MADRQNIIVGKDDIDTRLSTWIIRTNKSLNFNTVNILCRKGLVRVNGKKTKTSYRLALGDSVSMPIFSSNYGNKNLTSKINAKSAQSLINSIIFKDRYLIAVNKPEGLASQGGTRQGINHIDAYKSLLRFEAEDVPRLVHRLDKDTSGVLLLARDLKTANICTSLFKEKRIEKSYWALVEGVPKKQKGLVESFIGKEDIWKPYSKVQNFIRNEVDVESKHKKKAVTYYKVMERKGSEYSWLLLKPSTGRTHQLRIHCAELGTPIVGDRKYKKSINEISSDFPYSFKKLFLHARSLFFIHPILDTSTRIEAAMPKHMTSVWKHFGWNIV